MISGLSDFGIEEKQDTESTKASESTVLTVKSTVSKKKTPNAEEKYPSAFLIFFFENRIFIKKQFKGLTNAQIAKKAGELWRQFDES